MFRWVDGSFGGRLRAKRRYSVNEISDIMTFIVHQYDTIAVLSSETSEFKSFCTVKYYGHLDLRILLWNMRVLVLRVLYTDFSNIITK